VEVRAGLSQKQMKRAQDIRKKNTEKDLRPPTCENGVCRIKYDSVQNINKTGIY
jgi:hypothetical protein